jgi:hypothetical protein
MNPDGSDIRWHGLAAADNPTGIAITEQGDILGTVNLHFGIPRSDTIVLWQLGAMYERPDYTFLNTVFRAHERMPILHDLGHRVPSGCDLWTRANDLAPAGRPWSANPASRQLLVTLYNSRQILRLELTPEGASYRATEHPFLTLKSERTHLTDVIEAPDGSLLVLDTGTWYPHCPSSLKSAGATPGAAARTDSGASAQAMSRWVSTISGPAGVIRLTVSPARRLSSAFAIGEIQLTWPRAGSTSSTPTMVTMCSSPRLSM